jgi:hypothetical protein
MSDGRSARPVTVCQDAVPTATCGARARKVRAGSNDQVLVRHRFRRPTPTNLAADITAKRMKPGALP